MRVGILTWSYPPSRNGLANAACEIAQALRHSGHEVQLFSFDRSSTDIIDGIHVIGCAPGRQWSRLRRLLCIGHLVPPLLFWRAVRRQHRRRPLALVEATNWYAPGALIALIGPVPLVTRNSTPAAITSAAPTTLRDRLDRLTAIRLERISARKSASLISNTASHAHEIVRLYGTAAPGPGHAVAGLSLPAPILQAGAQAAYPPPGDVVRLLFVGRPQHRKGYRELLDAASRLAAEAEHGALDAFHLNMVGITERDAGPLPEALRSRLTLIPTLSEAALHAAFADAHVVVAPSRYESFGLVYQEAMAFGRPLLACAEDASARQCVGETGAGLLAPACDPNAIADALRRLIADPALRQTLHHASRNGAGRFDRASLATETIALYRYALASNANRCSNASSSDDRPAPASSVS